jgi:hypothetical protein
MWCMHRGCVCVPLCVSGDERVERPHRGRGDSYLTDFREELSTRQGRIDSQQLSECGRHHTTTCTSHITHEERMRCDAKRRCGRVSGDSSMCGPTCDLASPRSAVRTERGPPSSNGTYSECAARCGDEGSARRVADARSERADGTNQSDSQPVAIDSRATQWTRSRLFTRAPCSTSASRLFPCIRAYLQSSTRQIGAAD